MKHAHKMGGFFLQNKKAIICPQCQKEFYPAPEHSYSIENKKRLVCSYHCMREWQKHNKNKVKKGAIKK